jgi:GNAT superfamily N-acetyltransferase
MLNTRKNVKHIASSLGIRTAKFWIEALQTLPLHRVGTIKVSAQLQQANALQQLAAEMAFLASEAGFYLPLVLGKSAQVMGHTEIKLQQDSVVDALQDAGVQAVAIDPKCVLLQTQETISGRSLLVVTIDTKSIVQAIYNHKVPVLSPIGFCREDRLFYELTAINVAKELVKWLQALKLIVVGNRPLRIQDPHLIFKTYSELEFQKMVYQGILPPDLSAYMREGFDLLKYLGPNHSMQITSLSYSEGKIQSTGLLEELIGNGSGIKLVIPPVITAYPFNIVRRDLLLKMANQSFSSQGRELVDEYFEHIMDKNPTVYLDFQEKGGAITYPIKESEYLCKLFTLSDYEGLGIGSSIIETVIMQKQRLAWRTSLSNQQAVDWYGKLIQEYEGISENHEPYMIYGIGIPQHAWKKVIQQIINIPATMKNKA